MSRARGVTLPPDWPEATLLRELPAEVRAKADLVGWLAQAVHTTLHFSENEATREWEEPKARDLRALASAVRRLEGALERLHPAIVGNAATHAGMTRVEIRTALHCLRDEADHWLTHRGERHPGTKPDARRRDLEAVVAHELQKAGIRLSRYRGGVLARTLLACYTAAGIAAPEADSLLPTLQRLAGVGR